MRHLERETLDYIPFYCEENAWRLLQCESLAGSRAWALIVSNDERRVVVLRQRSGRPVDGLVQWDYHVFVVVEDQIEGYLALDLDSDLPFPCQLRRYVEDSFPIDLRRPLIPKFRALPARAYVLGLASDRSHMKRPDGSWLAPPPPWEPPGSERKARNNLMQWTDMSLRAPGRVLSVAALRSIARSSRVGDGRLPR